MKMMNKVGALLLSAVLCVGMAVPAFAYGGEPVEEVEQPVLTDISEEDAVTVTDETSGALTPEGNLTLVDDYHTNYSDGSGQQFITLVSKSGNTFYLVIDRNAKGQQTVHFMNLVDESDLLALMEDEDADAYTAEKEAAAQAELERKQAEEDAKKAEEEAAASGTEQPKENKITKYARSELMPDLQIVPQEQFENAQRIRNERSVRSTAEAENRLPLNIHGKSLLAGNAYCGHCGAKLELTSSRKWRKMADGSLDDTLRIRYTCYGKLRKQTNCTGQTGYTVHILDEIIDKAVRQIFSKMRGIPKEQIVTKRYEKENAERKNHLQDLQTQRNKAEKDLFALKTEVLACIKGESVLPRETLAEMITAQEEKLTELENLCEAASEELEKTAELMDKVSRLYDELISYADLYDSANFEAKKMIVNQLIRRVDVYRGYQINISFNFDLTPYIEGE